MIIYSVLLSCLLSSTFASRCQRVVCYYTNWAQYRPDPFKFFPENMDPRLCTHINYAFATMNGNQLKPFEWNDDSEPWMKGMYQRSVDYITQHNPSAKLLLSVGGWNMGSAPFTSMVKTPEGRYEFATSSVTFLRQRGFHGLDLDWEYPANRGSPPEDRDNYVKLLEQLHGVFTREEAKTGNAKLLLTAAVSAGESTTLTAYNVTEIAKYLDFVNIMTYDLHGSWENFTGHNSPLYPRSNEVGGQAYLNVDWAAQNWVSLGLPKHKLVLGLPTYGRTFTLQSALMSGLGDHTAGAGTAGTYTREAGFLSYYEICKMIKNGANVMRDPEQRVPYLVSGNQWVGYDDTTSLREKVNYMNTSGYGGVMIWSMDLDDFSGFCGEGNYSLIKAIADECQGIPAAESIPLTVDMFPHTRMSSQGPPLSSRHGQFPHPSHKPGPARHLGLDFTPSSGRRGSQVRMFSVPSQPVNYHDQTRPKGPIAVQKSAQTSSDSTFVLQDFRDSSQPYYFTDNAKTAPQQQVALPVSQSSRQGSSSLKNAQNPRQMSFGFTNSKNSPKATLSFNASPPQPRSSVAIGQIPLMAESSFTKSQKSRDSLLPSNFMTKLLQGGLVSGREGIRLHPFNDDSTELFNCLTKTDGFYPSPTSCQHFFICKDRAAFRKSCEKRLVYNPGKKYCDWPYNYKCEIDGTDTPSTSQRAVQEAVWQSSPHAYYSRKDGVHTITRDQHGTETPVVKFCDGKPDGRYTDPTTCSNYIACVSYITYVMPCATGTVYSSKNKGCNIPENVPECNK